MPGFIYDDLLPEAEIGRAGDVWPRSGRGHSGIEYGLRITNKKVALSHDGRGPGEEGEFY
jgi:hypothetical protein